AGRDLAVDPLRARRHREILDDDRVRARARMDRSLVGGVTGLDRREALRADEPDAVVREEAAVAGTILHAVLERMDHAREAGARLAWATEKPARRLEPVPDALRAGTAKRIRDVLSALAGGRAAARARAARTHPP